LFSEVEDLPHDTLRAFYLDASRSPKGVIDEVELLLQRRALPDGRAITASLHHGVFFTRRGSNLLAGRENDRWGIGFFHFGLSEPLLAGLTALDVNRRSEGGVEAFNLAIAPWLRLSADLQVIDPWNPSKSRATYAALRLQTKF
jgi:hypothetical protein